MRTRGTDGSSSKADSSEENLSTTTKVFVERVDDECADETSSQEDDGVDEPDDPLVLGTFADTELLREGQVGAVGSSLSGSVNVRNCTRNCLT